MTEELEATKTYHFEPVTTDALVNLTDKNGVLDILTASVKVVTDNIFNKTNMTASEIASITTEIYAANIQNAIQFLLQKDQSYLQTALLDAQIRLANAQTAQTISATKIAEEQAVKQLALLDAQIALTQAQAQAFRSDGLLKLLSALLNSWNVRKTADTGTELYAVLDKYVANGVAEKIGETLDIDIAALIQITAPDNAAS